MTKDERIEQLHKELSQSQANYAALADEKTAIVREHERDKATMNELRRQASERQAELDQLKTLRSKYQEADKLIAEARQRENHFNTLLYTIRDEHNRTLRAVVQEMRRELKKEGGF